MPLVEVMHQSLSGVKMCNINENKTYPTPEQLLPHNHPMIVISKILNCDIDNGTLTALITPSKDDVFYQPQINGIPSYFAMEYMAQSIGCFAGIFDRQQIPPQKSGIGFLLGTKKMEVFTPIISINDTYSTEINLLFMEENLASFECCMFNSKHKTIAKAIINTYRPKADKAMDFIMEHKND